MKNLFGEEYTEIKTKRKPINKTKLNWENRFQRWSDKQWNNETPLGKCGYSVICDYCKDSEKGRPCVRALNAYCRDNKKTVNYSDNDYAKIWSGEF